MSSTREKLPDRRRNVTQKVRVNSSTVHYTLGFYPDDRVGELFIDMHKYGAAIRTWAADMAKVFSVALQHGAPLETLIGLFVGSKSDPSGRVECHDRIVTCTSVMDLVARSMAIDYLGRGDLADVPLPVVETKSVSEIWSYESPKDRAGKITERVPNSGDQER